jgi:hypothetical protein
MCVLILQKLYTQKTNHTHDSLVLVASQETIGLFGLTHTKTLAGLWRVKNVYLD